MCFNSFFLYFQVRKLWPRCFLVIVHITHNLHHHKISFRSLHLEWDVSFLLCKFIENRHNWLEEGMIKRSQRLFSFSFFCFWLRLFTIFLSNVSTPNLPTNALWTERRTYMYILGMVDKILSPDECWFRQFNYLSFISFTFSNLYVYRCIMYIGPMSGRTEHRVFSYFDKIISR